MPREELPPLFGPGQRLGRYDLIQRLAVGGMAEVYLATAKGPGDFRKLVAIKRLLPQNSLDPQLLRMFLDEARLMARLGHPNVPQVIDVDDGGGVEVPFFVMEYVHGTDLRAVLNAAAGPLPFEQSLAIAAAVAAGLHHAHEQRGDDGQSLEIVHRDISPSNILISFDGSVKVTDFGVAKWTEQKSFTHQGQLKGKFAHMSPEQCRGETLDRRSDVFALGTLLHEMTTGHPPFVAESDYELLTRIIAEDAPAPVRAGQEYPPALAKIVRRSLERSRDARYATTQEMQLELESFAREQRWVVSPVALSGYLESLLGARVTEWREALRSGQTLADHLERAAGGGRVSPGPAAAERTATDAFAGMPAAGGRVPRRVTAPRPATDAAAGEPPASSPGPSSGSPSSRGTFTRALAIGAGVGIAIAVLAAATELTSRWQRSSVPSGGPTLPAAARAMDLSPAPPAGDTSARPTVAGANPGAGVPAVGRAPAGEAPAPVTIAPAMPALTLQSSSRPTSRSASSSSTAGGGSDGDAAKGPAPPSRREGSAPHAIASSLAPDNAPPGGETPAPTAGVPTAEANVPPPSQPSPSPPASTQAAPPARVKVWDPDSPIPP